MNDEQVEQIMARLRSDGPWFWEEVCAPDNTRLQLLQGTRVAFRDSLIGSQGSPQAVLEGVLNQPGLPSQCAAIHAMVATDLSAEMLDRARLYVHLNGINGLTVALPPTAAARVPFRVIHTIANKLNRARVEKSTEIDLHHDVLLIAFFGGFSSELHFPSFRRCTLGAIVGNPEMVREFFQQVHLSISSQVRGGGSVTSGCSMQKKVIGDLEQRLVARAIDFGRMPGNRFPAHVGEGLQFDAVYRIGTPPRSYVSVEVAFQETTNSVIERKAKEAEGSRVLMNSQGFKSCYVIGGAGWYARPAALKRLIRNADLCVSPVNLDALVDYIADL